MAKVTIPQINEPSSELLTRGSLWLITNPSWNEGVLCILHKIGRRDDASYEFISLKTGECFQNYRYDAKSILKNPEFTYFTGTAEISNI